jgi:hypothetical protein
MVNLLKVFIISLLVIAYVALEFKTELISLFSNYSYLISYLSTFAIIMTTLLRTRQIMALLSNIKAKFQGTKKIEAQICKNDQIDAIQNLTISNIENRLTTIEEKLKNANM